MLRAINIQKSYGTLQVLKGISIEVAKGEIISLTGASGAGKSTLLHILGTLDKADSGDVWMNETSINTLKGNKLAAFRNKHIGFVFQFHHLLPEFSALENVCIPGWLAGKKKQAVKEEALRLLEMLNLSSRIENKPNQLSGGEQQRVAVARALINKPDIVFADEPTGNLDEENEQRISALLKDIHRQGRTVVMVTHNLYLACMAERIIRLQHGKYFVDNNKENHHVVG